MEPSLLMALFAGLAILSTWVSVPFTTLNPQRPVMERLVGSFQLTAAAHGISSLCCRSNQPENNISALWNQTLPFEVPLPEETLVPPVTQMVADEEASTTTIHSAMIPTPTAPFAGARHIVYDTFEESPIRNNPEWFIARLIILVGKHVRCHNKLYTLAILSIVQVMATRYFIGAKQSPSSEPRRESTQQTSESSQPPEGASNPLALLDFIQRSLLEYQNRTDAAINQRLEDFLGKFEPLERRITELQATVNVTPQQSLSQKGDGSALIQSQVDDLVVRLEHLHEQFNDFFRVPEVSQDNGIAAQIEALSREIAQLKAERTEMRARPWETAMEETANELHTLRTLLKEKTDDSTILETIAGLSSRVGAVEAQQAEKPWELSTSKLATEVLGLDEKLKLLPPPDQGDNNVEGALTLIKRVQKDLDELKGFAVLNSELRSVEAEINNIKEKVDSKPWAEALTGVKNEINSLRQDMSSLKNTSSTLRLEHRKVADDLQTVSQFMEQLKTDEPWKRDEVLTGPQLAAVKDVVALKDTLATKEETKALSETIQRTEMSLQSGISKAWQADLTKLDRAAKELERSLRSEIDSTRDTFATNKDLDILSTQVKEFATRPAGNSSGGVVTHEELQKVREFARDASNSAISCVMDLDVLKVKFKDLDGKLDGQRNILVAQDIDIEKCAKKLNVERKKVSWGAPAPSEPTLVTIPKAETKPDKSTTASHISTDKPKSDPKSEEPKEDSKSDKGKQLMTQSDKPQGKAEPTPESSGTSTSAKSEKPGSDDKPKPSGMQESIWAVASKPPQSSPKSSGLEASMWATTSTADSSAGESQKKGKNKKHHNRK